MNRQRQSGFSLVELAMVLFILSLLLGGLLVPLASQLEARQRNDALDQLNRIKEALVGYAIINGYLPCYTTQTDPTSASYGVADSPCNPTGLTTDGILPWKTLGLVNGMDPWGIARSSSSDPWTGYWRYRVDSNFSNSGSPFSLSSSFSDNLSVVDAEGNALTASTEHPVAIIYSTGANQVADGDNASYEQTASDNPTYEGGPASSDFDDITIWITRPLLFSRMVSAGTLP